MLPFKTGDKKAGTTELNMERIRFSQVIKAQFEVFRRYYPELIERNQIKYPIDDKLLAQMPELHQALNPPKAPPAMKRVLLGANEFENLLYLWEFFNNFKDFLDIPKFSLEELQAALKFSADASDPGQLEAQFERGDDVEPFTWEQRMTMKEIRDSGFNLVSSLHGALARVIICDLEKLNGGNPAEAFNQSAQIGIRSHVPN